MIRVLTDHHALSEAAATHIINIARHAIDDRGGFDLILAGGRTPFATYRILAERTSSDDALWPNTRLFWGDERCVLPDDPESNYLTVKRALLDRLATAPRQVRRLQAERPELDDELKRYARLLPREPDLIILGCGRDAHVASLFPASPALDVTSARLALVDAPTPPRRRITITPPVIASARDVLVLVSGPRKAEALHRVFAPQGSVHESPARLVRTATWIIDREAAGDRAHLEAFGVNLIWDVGT